jgi:NADPH-dependent 2,4-dienoyl-CoA reductase/sulfur reductase-like enzyme/nitrite reductase/ring-hydroxylating ferredoxin subunit
MSGEGAAGAGPDLAAGVPISAIPDGGMLAGRAGDDAVLLFRRGEEVFAIGSACTHYGGPLAEGIVVGDTVRCPWHHACFSLRSGENLRPPALTPVAAWEVVREGDTVRVGAKRAEPSPRGANPLGPDPIVIVGAGPAGLLAALTLRREGYAGTVRWFGAEATPPVDRPNLSKDYLAGKAPEEWIPLRPPEVYADLGIRPETNTEVVSIEPAARRVTLSDGRSIPYGALLLATGTEPVRLDVPGASLPHVHTLRTLADSRAIIAQAEKSKRAVVVGSSFIGLEVAASLRERGVEVHVVSKDARPLERILGPEVGDFVRGIHESHGVVFHLETTVASIDARAATLENGERLAADLVVVGIGVRPRTQLAEKAGLRVERGVIVDERLETSAPGIYAAGDIARYPDPRTGSPVRIEHFVHAERQGQTAARNMLGRREPFRIPPFFWSQHYDVVLNYAGHAEKWDEIRVEGSLAARDAKLTYLSAGRALAVVTVGRDRENLQAEARWENDAAR